MTYIEHIWKQSIEYIWTSNKTIKEVHKKLYSKELYYLRLSLNISKVIHQNTEEMARAHM
jgi:hypothetical protein